MLGDSPITFPIEWDRSKIPGYAIRASVPNWHGFTAFVVMSHVAARFFEPQVSGIGATPVGSEVFRIDHDENFNETTHLQYQPWKKGPWFGFNWRYDSGLVAGPVPCVGGNCANGPNGTDTEVDVSGSDAGSTVPGRTLLRERACHSDHADQPERLMPGIAVRLEPGEDPGGRNGERRPQSAAHSAAQPVRYGGGHRQSVSRRQIQWSLRLSAVNVTNEYALYNFLSTFSGTHYVTPRAITATIGFHF